MVNFLLERSVCYLLAFKIPVNGFDNKNCTNCNPQFYSNEKQKV